MVRARGIAVTTLAVVVSAVSLAAQEFPIKLDRASKVGDARRVTASGSRNMHMLLKAGEQTVRDQTQEMSAALIAVEKVAAVDSSGRPTAIEYVVEKCTCETPEGKQEVVASGQVVLGKTIGDRTAYELKEGALTDVGKQVFDLLGTLGTRASDDEILGTSEPQSVGASWPMSTDKACKELESTGAAIRPDDLHGTVKLVSVKKVDGRECAEVSGTMTSDKIGFAQIPNLEVQKSEITATFWGLFPTDLAKPRQEEKSEMTMSIAGKISAGPQAMTMEMSLHQAISRVYAAAKASN
jgi:hypothetical protein